MENRTKGHWRLLVLAVISIGLLVAIPGLSREKVRVADKQGGCFYDADSSYSLRQSKQGFGRGDKLLSNEELRHLREVLLTAEDGRDSLLQSLGVDEATVEAHRETILNAALEGDSLTPRVFPEELRGMVDLETVRGVVFQELDAVASDVVVVSTSWCSFSVELPGDPLVVASSTSCLPWMLPWTIQAGEREWRTWSIAVPSALRRLTRKKSPNDHLLDGTHYWSEGFWSDSSIWRGTLRDGLGMQLNAHHARQLAVNLDGWSTASAQFDIIEAKTGLINSCPLSLVLTLEPRRPGSLDRVRWYNRLEDGTPTIPWDPLLALSRRAGAEVAKHPWLADWRAKGGQVWLSAHDESGLGCLSLLLPAWRDAGYSGKPDFELTLTGLGTGYARLYMGEGWPTSVIVYAGIKGSGEHWLTDREVSFYPSTYLVVTRDGQVERRKVAER